jgi:hypothetical protein
VSIRQPNLHQAPQRIHIQRLPAYVSIRQPTSLTVVDVRVAQYTTGRRRVELQHTSAYVSIRQHTSAAYVSIRQSTCLPVVDVRVAQYTGRRRVELRTSA